MTQAADLNYSEVLHYLALHYCNGNKILNMLKSSYEEYEQRLNKAYQANSPDLLFIGGHAYLKGEDRNMQNLKLTLQEFL